MLIYGKDIREQIKERVCQTAVELKMGLAIIRVGDDPSSLAYVRGICKFAEEAGVKAEIINLPDTIAETELLRIIADLNHNPEFTGIMLQTPFPASLNASRLVNAVDFDKDVEGIHNYNLGKLVSKEEGVRPCTPKAVISMLKAHNIPIEGQKVTIIGRSMTVGSPLALMMTAENATVTVCHTRSRNLKEEALRADILVAAVGKREFITADMVHKDMVVIDVGINFDENGKMRGDVHEEARNCCRIASAVPGGIGIITVAELFDNLRILSQRA
ncbi:MAG: bifunctional 5,10-methylenetetrahydrofolate dehydrogenase/5,10-methenyltetrahydrofolate cyclohydrolase [Syntrophomonas sp.]|uniref:bifunctional 5,10-methylenetetrahydrofolate dehydrogenase/5,10-methenyltetrahydrofolate cyclohydrolase n=1 Tax=Syntrophomonas sp. TaxID=2053627 RepID=UPI002615C2AB|nr:bifunctional 5,10-methylenetetrahydrofolate dehydrogenase/5,10-methenyltetrahydrofolate cyclohydrolase [Syntrophomonas sp.]MDD2510317.1 bifunctional 5,10-methylenetetrahydrofolate dehydrogenase/5,10-methenyltetrahydrofolate cyclohydrolase [Syntrophomonas sp.]MDD3880362.1 bifunctional 5,10-methylenetetrahydrofolate dehydrogenase/5,10-methenyltetrahydrofolate cyclohydrolase [Syntrophomonas sp.]MDD4626314.1 bifunctional 5,10-methylenetetrahydrofolate dehydrogenase/5,10-methenyltetrahydrofolate c